MNDQFLPPMFCVALIHNNVVQVESLAQRKITKNVSTYCLNRESASPEGKTAPILLVQVAKTWRVSLSCIHDGTQQSKITNNRITQQANTKQSISVTIAFNTCAVSFPKCP